MPAVSAGKQGQPRRNCKDSSLSSRALASWLHCSIVGGFRQIKSLISALKRFDLPFDEIGAFMISLREQEGMEARSLAFAILTAARSGEVRGAAWEEIDLNDKT